MANLNLRRSLWASLFLVLLMGVAGTASANIVPSLVGGAPTACSVATPCHNGSTVGWEYDYDVMLDNTQYINTGINAAFYTIYDFGAVIGSIVTTGLLSTDFSAPVQNLIDTPAFSQSGIDSGNLLNVRQTATTNIGPNVGSTDLGNIYLVSAQGLTTPIRYDGQATSDTVHTVTGDTGPILGPSIPEPATAGLFLIGLAGALAVGRKRATRS